MTDGIKRFGLPKCSTEHTDSQTTSGENLADTIAFARYRSNNAVIGSSSRNERHITIIDKIWLNIAFCQQHIEQIAHLERRPRRRINNMTVSDGFCRQRRKMLCKHFLTVEHLLHIRLHIRPVRLSVRRCGKKNGLITQYSLTAFLCIRIIVIPCVFCHNTTQK